ncbi:bifunctional YncE family protein/alkaline phosphatase family protein [Chitinophaga ginsengisegetis]|uniref:bifunctional YncE family protein/alkaline phosphatase family protein n=1 Tax=Chitinophaga ginsengisegetis TaxID=393003 RepID=UPI000DBACB02|nr:bifunctional YncE family protein/alkaline phosphatase family protein [Chitinophaga ginsengisegetis]MDR6566534.1 YVTN family beta-propeller protein [Chitinophaga ginsengisegetis]MDR6646264.1 YVTN family beta-propeller protein [Chitinophaga ginsengisegetis]MDR6651143.1 YVTN family beta-propeller protein [Chitinophaga ginsengisegetis]
MKRILVGLALLGALQANAQTADTAAKRVLLPNGWALTPVGHSLPLGDLPLNMVVSPSEKLIAVTNNGQSKQTIQLIDAGKEIVLDEVSIPKAWLGLAFSRDEKKLYASGANDNVIWQYTISNNKLLVTDSIRLGLSWPKEKICPTGMTIDYSRNRLYVATKEDNSLYIIDLLTNKVISKVALGAEAYTVTLSKNRNLLYISLWGGDAVAVFDVASNKITNTIKTGSHPNEMILSANGKYLYVANANDNSVSVISTAGQRVIESLQTALYPDAPAGSTTNGLALSANNNTLYIANADNNCLAVFDVETPGKSRSEGFIPVGWYPTCVRRIGKKLFVANGKGFTSMANPEGPNPVSRKDESGSHLANTRKDRPVQYIAGLFKGTLSMFNEPGEVLLGRWSKQVYENTPYTKEKEQHAAGEAGNPIPRAAGQSSPIKYVFYIIKENRTYDQVLGDMPRGNGDSSLCIFPDRITPNQHRLSNDFVLLDNFYVDAEVSADGHNWSMAAYATDYVEKTWPTSYGGRGGTYDYEGSRKVAYPEKGFIWDYCQRASVSYRTYGEFAGKGKATLKSLEKYFCTDYPSFDLTIQDVARQQIWQRDFDSLLAIDAVPHFNSIRLGNDHTSGMRKGAYSPYASVADNDLAVGRLVEYISHSKIWKESAIFILEDDAQNGPDHVDAHRSPAYVISPYVKRNTVNHTMYSTSGMLRTMELILGLPPMSQYDAAATPMWELFSATPDLRPYTVLPANVDINERNTAWNESARRSASFDLAHEDRVPDLELNEVVWKAIRGEQAVMPAPRRSAFVKLQAAEDEDD